jgi:hypothetical protein
LFTLLLFLLVFLKWQSQQETDNTHSNYLQCLNTLLAQNCKQNKDYVRFEVFTAVTMKNGVFGVVTPCGSCNNRRFGGTWRLLNQGDKNRWTRN